MPRADNSDMPEADCFSCVNNTRDDLPRRERAYLTPGWRVAHALGTPLPGWLVVVPRRHLTSLDELTTEEAAELGPLLRDLTAALREVVGCEKTYVALFAEAEGFQHVHFHVIPRAVGAEPQALGPQVFSLLAGDPTGYVSEAVMDDVATKLARRLGAE